MSTKTVADKLLIKQDASVWLSHAEQLARIGPLPAGACVVGELGSATVALVFADAAATARDILTAHGAQLAEKLIFWVAYPKGNKADINRDTLWPILAEYGMRPIAQVAIDPIWSALRFRPIKSGEAPFTGGQK
jgi:hypothetical protein